MVSLPGRCFCTSAALGNLIFTRGTSKRNSGLLLHDQPNKWGLGLPKFFLLPLFGFAHAFQPESATSHCLLNSFLVSDRCC